MSVVPKTPDLLATIQELEKRLGVLERMVPAATRVVDAANNLRVFEGQLDGITAVVGGSAYTYPANTYGLTVMDAGHNVIFDSLGISNAMALKNSFLDDTSQANSTISTNPSNWTTIANMSLPFSLSRPGGIMVFVSLAALLSVTTTGSRPAVIKNIRLNIPGYSNGNGGDIAGSFLPGGTSGNGGVFLMGVVPSMPAGNWTVNCDASAVGVTGTISSAFVQYAAREMYVFGVGG